MNILEKIVVKKKEDVNRRKEISKSIDTSKLSAPRDFIAAIKMNSPAIIAEIKKASPSKGILRSNLDVGAIARSYEDNGASCLSVITEESFFLGSDANIGIARDACKLPILRKDFIIDEYQIHESRCIGADAILLIAALLSEKQLIHFTEIAKKLSLSVLIECHDREEITKALKADTPLIGINNRNLKTFETTIETSLSLNEAIPQDYIIVSESGLNDNNITELRDAGINAFLIGETFMRAQDPGDALNKLLATI